MYCQNLKFEVIGDVSLEDRLGIAASLVEGIDRDWVSFRMFSHKASVITAGSHDAWETIEQRACKLVADGKISIVSPKDLADKRP